MPERDRDELSPQLEDFKMEVAQEIGLGHRFQGAKKDGATTGVQPGK
ncbi:small, acid-soluble spore protein, alpha/beta type [Heliobacterium undosum]|uniref:Small, acid-soluble spore protein, alpha/beta type n=1 Tax=Heliomicrobium undosum TaxID=121734 RepID=A0A845KYQ1_9FIRM|nr:small, acid-soluble spore protein, alpha/beta type [Heliomicrobium undosum]MZP29067.1 small, acid-soluble spore protein, alpha/beta type [Heliomicrobium undosum]